jgi:peroxiredoxin
MHMRRWISMLIVVLVSVALLFSNVGDVMALKVGDKAPDFTLPSTTGEKISLSQFRGKKPVVLFFYLFAFGGA